MAHKYVEDLRETRKKAAEIIHSLRAETYEDAPHVRVFRNEHIRWALAHDRRTWGYDAETGLMRVTQAAFIAEAEECEAFAATPIRPQGDEYYSACGLEDAAYEARCSYAEHAAMLREAAASI